MTEKGPIPDSPVPSKKSQKQTFTHSEFAVGFGLKRSFDQGSAKVRNEPKVTDAAFGTSVITAQISDFAKSSRRPISDTGQYGRDYHSVKDPKGPNLSRLFAT